MDCGNCQGYVAAPRTYLLRGLRPRLPGSTVPLQDHEEVPEASGAGGGEELVPLGALDAVGEEPGQLALEGGADGQGEAAEEWP